MGTRADFYIGEGETAEWLGSVAYDGYEWQERGKACSLWVANTENDFRKAVNDISNERKDFTAPEEGWPWPWEDSRTTDYAYCFTSDGLKIFRFGHLVIEGGDEDEENDTPKSPFPDMKERQNVQLGEKSGLIVVAAREKS